jgi:hypothetical protein
MIVVETRKQHAKVGVIQSLSACITTIRVGKVVASNINVVKREVLIAFVAKLGSGLGGVSVIRNLSQSLTLIVFFVISHGGYIQMSFFPKTPKLGVSKFPKLGLPTLWKAINSCADIRLR